MLHVGRYALLARPPSRRVAKLRRAVQDSCAQDFHTGNDVDGTVGTADLGEEDCTFEWFCTKNSVFDILPLDNVVNSSTNFVADEEQERSSALFPPPPLAGQVNYHQMFSSSSSSTSSGKSTPLAAMTCPRIDMVSTRVSHSSPPLFIPTATDVADELPFSHHFSSNVVLSNAFVPPRLQNNRYPPSLSPSSDGDSSIRRRSPDFDAADIAARMACFPSFDSDEAAALDDDVPSVASFSFAQQHNDDPRCEMENWIRGASGDSFHFLSLRVSCEMISSSDDVLSPEEQVPVHPMSLKGVQL